MIIFESFLTTFEKSTIFLGQLGQQWKLARALNRNTISKFNQDKFVQIREMHDIKTVITIDICERELSKIWKLKFAH